MEKVELAKNLFLFGALLFVLMGFLHAVLSIADDFKPKKFTPVDDQVRHLMNETAIRLNSRTNMWLAWLGFNISHGLGAFFFGLVYMIIALHDFSFVVSFEPLMPLAILMSLSYFLLAIRYWFYAPAVGTGVGLVCFILTYLLV